MTPPKKIAENCTLPPSPAEAAAVSPELSAVPGGWQHLQAAIVSAVLLVPIFVSRVKAGSTRAEAGKLRVLAGNLEKAAAALRGLADRIDHEAQD